MSSTQRIHVSALALSLLFPFVAGAQPRQSSVPLRSGAKVVSAETTREFARLASASSSGLHGLAVFHKSPTVPDRDSLASKGITVLSRLTQYAYLIRARPTASFADTAVTRRIAFFSATAPRDRVEPLVWSREFHSFAIRDAKSPGRNLVLNEDGSLNLIVRFHDDIADSDATRVLETQVRASQPLGSKRWRVTVTTSQMQLLAANDAVRWIDAVRPAGGPDVDQVRSQIGVTSIQGFDPGTGLATGLTGSGITVGVYDYGIDKSHPDFGSDANSRIILDDPSKSAHGTAMAGIIAGDGTQSGKQDSWNRTNPGTSHQYRGIASAAKLLDAPLFVEATPVSAEERRKHITSLGMDISNHSYYLTVDGFYGKENELHDNMIRGDDAGDGMPIPARLHVHSAGNFASNPGPWPEPARQQRGYFTLGNQLKNALVVGNFYFATGRNARNSSLGPTTDGRIKPDVVAPGTFVMATGYCSSTDNEPYYAVYLGPKLYPCGDPPGPDRRNFYHELTGTSVGAAVVTGMLTLVLQEIANSGENFDVTSPLPSTLRAIAIHSAHDIVYTPPYPTPAAGTPSHDWANTDENLPVRPSIGPDFITGFGLVDAAAAVDIVTRGLYREAAISVVCETKSYPLYVSGGPDSVTVTLAWDDPARYAEIAYDDKLLVNDLDLVLVDPQGTRHYPWAVDQEITDEGGTTLAHDAQGCDTHVKVKRKLMPTTTPAFYGVGDARNVDDPIADPVLPATTGRDRLNNVEQVKTPTMDGKWTVEVTGFHIEDSPQRFSLIGVPWPEWLIWTPRVTCRTVPFFCDLRLQVACARFPLLCDRPDYIYVRHDSLTFRFRSVDDRKIIQFSSLCFALTAQNNCAVKALGQSARSRTLTVGPGARNFAVELFDERGKLVARNVGHSRTKSLRVPAGSGELFLMIRARSAIGKDVNVHLPVSLHP